MMKTVKNEAENILSNRDNRQYQLPQKPWLLYQEWHNVLMFHWKVAAHLIQPLIPEKLQLDISNGSAYISIVAFEVKNFNTSFGSVPFTKSFGEVNVRTYVTVNGVKGIYFFSLHADHLLAVIGAKTAYQLPYSKAEIRHSENIIYCKDRTKKVALNMLVNAASCSSDYHKTELDVWLSERHAFYQVIENNVYRCDIHHKEWPLEELFIYSGYFQLDIGAEKSIRINNSPLLAHCAPKLSVLFWNRIQVFPMHIK